MSAAAKVGDILAGKYRVERVLGQGGMGVVVAARHLHLGERVAIKFLHSQGMQSREIVGRFVREARAAVRIRSEYVARILDVGELANGAPFIVMEYLDGSDLSAILKTSGPLPIEVAVEYVLQACEAIAEAHSLGIIHRDLKPANLFLSKRADGSPSVKVIDFGISKVAAREGDVAADIEMTQTAMMMGSPLYMAPEQMRSARSVDARADIWSLGGILHALLTGSPPFRAESVMLVYELILEGVPPLRSKRPDAPAGLEEVVRRALQREPNDRYPNVAEFAAALAPFAPVHARISADRIARMLHATEASGTDLAQPFIASAATPDRDAAPAALVRDAGSPASPGAVSTSGSPPFDAGNPDKPRPSAAPNETALGSASGSSMTDGSWSAPRASSRRPRSIVVLGGIAGALAIAGAVFILRGQLQSVTPPAVPIAEPSGAGHAAERGPPQGGGETIPMGAASGAPVASPELAGGSADAPPRSGELTQPPASASAATPPTIPAAPTGVRKPLVRPKPKDLFGDPR
jgi:serine/threonine-protein kinase